jgi:hypothetical protein
MRLLGVGVFILGLGALLFIGILAIVRELFCECMLAAPSVTDAEVAGEYTGQSASGAFSAISTDR